jgi:hypothetical protein
MRKFYLSIVVLFSLISGQQDLCAQCIPNFYIFRPRAECLGSQGVRISYTQEQWVAHDVYRRAEGDSVWGPALYPNYWGNPVSLWGGSLLVNHFTASDHLPGQTYEYRFTRTLENVGTFTGYITVGCEVPEVVSRGDVILLVSQQLKPGIEAELETMRLDLVADGYRVYLIEASESASPVSIKNTIQNLYSTLEGEHQYLYIIGHVPVPYSGLMMSDDQITHRGAWPADVYYGDLDGVYTDVSINDTNAVRPENDNIPGDGKFDQNLLTSRPEIAVGRADFSRLPCFVGKTETDLTKRYLAKNHAFRLVNSTTSGDALMCDNMEFYYGNNPQAQGFIELYSKIGDNNFGAITNDLFPNYSYFPNVRDSLQMHSYLMSYISGTSSYTNIDNITTAGQINAMSGINSVFNWSFGAFFGDWDNACNLMRMFIGAPGTSLTQIWAGNPSAYFHMFGMNRTIGETILEHQWNYNTNHHNLPNPHADNYYRRVHIALMGDPTLRLSYERPPVFPTASAGTIPGTAKIEWMSNGDSTASYLIFRATSDDQAFEQIGSTAANQFTFIDPTPLQGNSVYMVRAKALHTTGSGTYYNLSTGKFAYYNNSFTVSVALESDVICKPNNQVEITYNTNNSSLSNTPASVACYVANAATPAFVQSINLVPNSPILLPLPDVANGTWVKYITTLDNFPVSGIMDSVQVFEQPTAAISYEIVDMNYLFASDSSLNESLQWSVNGEVISNLSTLTVENPSLPLLVELTRSNVCGSSTDDVFFNVTGIAVAENEQWSIQPNPANAFISIQATSPISSVKLVDLTGRICFHKAITQSTSSVEIPLLGLSSGVYFCSIETNQKCYSKRLIVQH